MNRYEVIKDEVYQILTTNCFASKRKNAFEHLFSVTAMIQYLAKIRHLDLELASIIGILHDLATYKFNSSFDHANRSAIIAKDLLEKSNLFTAKEIELIFIAIKNHSNKKQIDDNYSELIKDADILVQYLNEPEALLPPEKKQRVDKLIGS
ncbi:HD domain-containing protein [Thomasclavelia sp.]|uniref:HD domain-containing protein n=1 Tax=Thomasclavelia sp. TaxID=3025757 RepID=UPI0025EA4F78|nr:HD domain-containing protein [Thomasclavelia sp.]